MRLSIWLEPVYQCSGSRGISVFCGKIQVYKLDLFPECKKKIFWILTQQNVRLCEVTLTMQSEQSWTWWRQSLMHEVVFVMLVWFNECSRWAICAIRYSIAKYMWIYVGLISRLEPQNGAEIIWMLNATNCGLLDFILWIVLIFSTWVPIIICTPLGA